MKHDVAMTSRTAACPDRVRTQPLTLPSSALVAGALLLDAPIDPRSALGRLGAPELRRPRPRRASATRAASSPGSRRSSRSSPGPSWPPSSFASAPARAPTRTLVWARARRRGGGHAGRRHDHGRADRRFGPIAERLVEACAVPERGPDLAHPRLVADLLAALLADDAPGRRRRPRPGVGDRQPGPAAAGRRSSRLAPATWRLETAWTDRDGPSGRRARRPRCRRARHLGDQRRRRTRSTSARRRGRP